MRKSHFNVGFLVLLGPIISWFLHVQTRKNKLKQQRVHALILSLCLLMLRMSLARNLKWEENELPQVFVTVLQLKDHLHWESFLAKMSAILLRDYATHSCLGCFGRYDTNKIISICVRLPKAAKASRLV